MNLKDKKEDKPLTTENVNKLLKEKQKKFNGLKSKIFPIKTPKHGTERLCMLASVPSDLAIKKAIHPKLY